MSRRPAGKRKWKKTCCLPSFVIFLFVLGCVVAGVTLLAIFRVDPKHLTVNAVLIAIAAVVGLAVVLNCRTWWQVLDSLLNSQRKRLHSAASRLHKLKSEGFMKVCARSLGAGGLGAGGRPLAGRLGPCPQGWRTVLVGRPGPCPRGWRTVLAGRRGPAHGALGHVLSLRAQHRGGFSFSPGFSCGNAH